MSLEDQQKRFLKLNGDRLHMTFMQATLHRPMIKAAGLSAVFNLVTMTGGNLTNIAASLTASALCYAVCSGASEFLDYFQSIRFGKNHNDLVIDKTPDESTAPTSDFNRQKSEQIKDEDIKFAIVIGFMGAIATSLELLAFSALDGAPPVKSTLYGSAGTTLAMCLLSHLVPSIHRFGKVADEKWVITEFREEPRTQDKKSPAGTRLTPR